MIEVSYYWRKITAGVDNGTTGNYHDGMISLDILPVPPLNKLKKGQRLVANGAIGTLLEKDARPQMLSLRFDDRDETMWLPYAMVTGLVQVIDPFDQIHPMLAKTVKNQAAIQKLIDDPLWWFEEKFDGERQTLVYDPLRGDFKAMTRVVGKGSGRLGESQDILGHFADLPVPDGGHTVFDCELTHPHGFAALRSIMGSDPQLALEKQQKIGPVEAKLFDVLWLGGRDLRGLGHVHRRIALTTWYHEVEGWAKKQHSLPEYWPYIYLSRRANTAPEKKAMLEGVLAAGGEGIMAKHAQGVYTNTTLPDQRSKHLVKIKPFTSDEFIIVGFENGKGQYNQAKLGAVKLAQWVPNADFPEEGETCDGSTIAQVNAPATLGFVLLDCGTSNIGTAAMEAAFRGDPQSFIGQVIEVKYQQRWPKTLALRHPSLLRFRPAWSGRRKGGRVRS
jgi:ATP-dependent DNA ligase